MADGKVIIATDLDSSGAVAGAKKLGSQLKSGIVGASKMAVAGIAAVGTASVAAGASMVKFAKDTADTGDHIDKMSQKLGMSAEAYQKWDYVAQISGTSIDGLRMGFKTLGNTIESASQGNEKALAKFEQIGITMDDLQNKSKEQIFEDTIKGLQNVTDESQKAALANQLFGRSGQELGPMLNSSNKDIDELMKKAEDYGMIMSDESVKATAEFTDSLTTMNQTFQGLKNRLTAEFLPALTEVTDGFALIFKGDTEEGLKKINSGIDKFVKKLNDILPKVLDIGGNIILSLGNALVQNLPKLIQTGTDLLIDLFNGILSALPQVIQMLPDVLRTIGSALTKNAPILIDSAIEILQMCLNFIFTELPQLIMELADFVATLDLSNVGTGFFDSLGKMLEEGLPRLVDSVMTLLTNLVTFIFEALPMIVDVGLQLVLSLANGILSAIPLLLEKLPVMLVSIVDGILSAIPMVLEAGVQLLGSLAEAIPQATDSLASSMPQLVNGIVDSLIANAPMIADAGVELFTALILNMPKILYELSTAPAKIVYAFIEALSKRWTDIQDAGFDLLKHMWDKIPQMASEIANAVGELWDYISDAFEDLYDDMFGVGENMTDGLLKGLVSTSYDVAGKLTGLSGIVDGVKSFFGIHSPSKVMEDEVGKWLAEGIVVGFDKYNPMEEINKSLEYGMNGLQTSLNQEMIVDYGSLANAQAEATSGMKIVLDDREFGRAVRGCI